ncbi:MAG: DUF6263 family protein [Planctomycetota bacterium]
MRTFALVLAIAVLGTAAGCGSGGQQFALNLPVQSFYVVDMSISDAFDHTSEAASVKQEQSLELRLRYTVKKVAEDGTHTIDVLFQTIKNRQKNPGGSAKFDTSKDDATIPVEFYPFRVLTGQSVEIDVSAQGKVTTVRGGSQLAKQLLSGFDVGDQILSRRLQASRDYLQEQFTEAAFKEVLQHLFARLPSESAGLQDQWTSESTYTKTLPRKESTSHTLAGLAEDRALVHTKADVTPQAMTKLSLGPNLAMRFNVNGTRDGEIYLDPKTGRQLSGKWTLNVKGKEFFDGPEGTPSRESGVTARSTITVKELSFPKARAQPPKGSAAPKSTESSVQTENPSAAPKKGDTPKTGEAPKPNAGSSQG